MTLSCRQVKNQLYALFVSDYLAGILKKPRVKIVGTTNGNASTRFNDKEKHTIGKMEVYKKQQMSNFLTMKNCITVEQRISSSITEHSESFATFYSNCVRRRRTHPNLAVGSGWMPD